MSSWSFYLFNKCLTGNLGFLTSCANIWEIIIVSDENNPILFTESTVTCRVVYRIRPVHVLCIISIIRGLFYLWQRFGRVPGSRARGRFPTAAKGYVTVN